MDIRASTLIFLVICALCLVDAKQFTQLDSNAVVRSSKSLLGVTGGSNATLGQFAWMASIVMDGANFCGGSIISDRWIITAGFCTDGYTVYVVTVGSLSSFGGTEDSLQRFLTTEAYRHPTYSAAHFHDNDIGLIHLQKALTYGDHVKPIRLPTFTMALENLVGKTGNVSGWGLTSDESNATISSKLVYTPLTIVEDSVCSEEYGNVMISTKICLSGKSKAGNATSTCFGDWGSPLVAKLSTNSSSTETQTVLAGIVSGFTPKSCTEGLPVIFTKVSSFLAFIEAKTDIAVGE